MLITPTADAVSHNLGGNKVASFGIAKNPAKLIQVVVRSLYSNPTLATLVELGQNAHDEHNRCGKSDIPFEVTLPTIWEPTLRVRDFGGGISHEYMMKGYTRIFESTKDEDATMSGGFGVGRCVVLSLSSTYTVITYINGKKRTYSVFESENGIELVHLATDDTNEPNGTEISAPVSQKEVEAFKSAAQRAYRYYKVAPTIKGVGADYKIVQPTYVLTGSNWAIESGNTQTSAICGIYHYNIDAINMGNLSNTHAELLSNIGLVLRFGPSDLDVQANRQGLHYNDRTRTAIVDALKQVEREASELITKQFADCTSYYQAKMLWGQMYSNPATRKLATIAKTLRNIQWNNLPIEDDRVVTKNIKNIVATGYTWRTGRRYPFKQTVKHDKGWEYIDCAKTNHLYINDCKGAIGRIKGALHEILEKTSEEHTAVAISFDNDAAKAEFFAKTHLTSADFTLTSSLPKPSRTVNYNAARAKANVFTFVSENSDATRASEAWDIADDIELDSDKGVYVVLDSYKAVRGYDRLRPYQVEDIIEKIKNIGGFANGEELIGIRDSASEELAFVRDSVNWQSLDEYIKSLLATYKIDQNDIQLAVNHSEYNNLPYEIKNLVNNKHYTCISHSTALKDLFNMFAELRKNSEDTDNIREKHSSFLALGGILNYSNVKPIHEATANYQAFLARFPIFKMVLDDIYYNTNNLSIVDQTLAILEKNS